MGKKRQQYLFMKDLEEAYKIDPNYLDKHTELTFIDRGDFIRMFKLYQVRHDLDIFVPFLATNVFDRYLSKAVVKRTNKITYKGQTFERKSHDFIAWIVFAILNIAIKYENEEEYCSLNAGDVASRIYKNETVGKVVESQEWEVLETLNYRLTCPTSILFLDFFRSFLSKSTIEKSAWKKAEELLKISLVDCGILRFLPSLQACSAISISIGDWPEAMALKTGYSIEDIRPCARRMANYLILR